MSGLLVLLLAPLSVDRETGFAPRWQQGVCVCASKVDAVFNLIRTYNMPVPPLLCTVRGVYMAVILKSHHYDCAWSVLLRCECVCLS